MSEKPSKDEVLDALDFMLNVIKEHDKDLDKVVKELTSKAKFFAKGGEFSCRLGSIEEKIVVMQRDINTLLKFRSQASQ